MEYNFNEIEKKWQAFWKENRTYQVHTDINKPKFYVLDMFPYPSGAGLHVGHPLGYIASDIYARYKRLKGFNVLHPMGYDAYGLPAEQYAIQTGQHPAITTEQNINRYREQLDKIGFSFDWDREVRTCDPEYYKWTQWAFIQMFESYYYLPPAPSGGGGECGNAERYVLEGDSPRYFTTDVHNWKLLIDYAKQMRKKPTEAESILWDMLRGKQFGCKFRRQHPIDIFIPDFVCLEKKLIVEVDGEYHLTEEQKELDTIRTELLSNWGYKIIRFSNDDVKHSPHFVGEVIKTELENQYNPNPHKTSNTALSLPSGEGRGGVARPISELVKHFEEKGTEDLNVAQTEDLSFTAEEWKAKPEKEKQETLMNYRIAYLADTTVNWCSDLGTVLANDEVNEGVSIRGGYPVEQRKMRQWSLRVSAYAQRLLEGLDKIDWTESLKETQRNWIGRSEGAEMQFKVKGMDFEFTIFTTRADTIFGVTFMVLAPESELVDIVTTHAQRQEVQNYLDQTKKRTERERIADRKVTGVFTGSYAINPVNGAEIPIWISDYVLAGYGTGAIMAVPGHDSRDYAFAKHFNLPIIPLIEGADISEESFDAKEGIMMNSGFLNGLTVKEAIQKAKEYIAENGLGKVKVNYRLRDAIFSRQRYWGEPFPIYYRDGMPYAVAEEDLPIELPEVDKFLPTETGEPPLGRAKNWEYVI